jgi:hypothetical protein
MHTVNQVLSDKAMAIANLLTLVRRVVGVVVVAVAHQVQEAPLLYF